MVIKSVAEDDSRIVLVRGEINLQTSPTFYSSLLAVVEQRPRKMIVDLGGVAYMDSSGVGTLVEIKRRVEGHNGRLVLAAPRPSVRGVLEIMQLHRFFTVCDSVDEARRA